MKEYKEDRKILRRSEGPAAATANDVLIFNMEMFTRIAANVRKKHS